MIRLLLLILMTAQMSVAASDIPVLLSLHGSNTVGQHLAPTLARAWAESEGWSIHSDQLLAVNERVIELRRDAEQGLIKISAHGTSTGLDALTNGRADLWMASRPVQLNEIKQHNASLGRLDDAAQEHVIALDGLAIIVHPAQAMRTLSFQQLRAVFAGEIRDWSQLGGRAGPIHLYARDEQSGTFDTFKTLVLSGAALSGSASRFESTDELAAAVVNDPNAIGFVGLAGIGGARAIAVSTAQTRPMSPTSLTVATEDYPLSRRLMLYSSNQRSDDVQRFIEFAQSREGQLLVDAVGFVGQGMSLHPAANEGTDLPVEYRELVDGARRLSVNLRFGNGRSFLDSKAIRDLERIADFLHAYPRDSHEIILIGFSDLREHNPILAVNMSNDRADYVASELARRGIAVHRSRGFGQALPVADNDNELGRSKNRRVEIWVRARGKT